MRSTRPSFGCLLVFSTAPEVRAASGWHCRCAGGAAALLALHCARVPELRLPRPRFAPCPGSLVVSLHPRPSFGCGCAGVPLPRPRFTYRAPAPPSARVFRRALAASSRHPGWSARARLKIRHRARTSRRVCRARASTAALVGSSSPGLGCCPGCRLSRRGGLHWPEPRLAGPLGGLHSPGCPPCCPSGLPGSEVPLPRRWCPGGPHRPELRLPYPGGIHAPEARLLALVAVHRAMVLPAVPLVPTAPLVRSTGPRLGCCVAGTL